MQSIKSFAGLSSFSALALVTLLGCSDAMDATTDAELIHVEAEVPVLVNAQLAAVADNGLCPGLENQGSKKAAQLLAVSYGRWRYAKRVSTDGVSENVSRCDGTMAYQIGSDEAQGDRKEAAACALARGEVVPFRVWRLERKGCPMIDCGETFGLVWFETNGGVFHLDVDGNPEGAPVMTLAVVRNERKGEVRDFELEQRIEGMPTTTLLTRTKENLACVTVVTVVPVPPIATLPN